VDLQGTPTNNKKKVFPKNKNKIVKNLEILNQLFIKNNKFFFQFLPRGKKKTTRGFL